MVLDIDRPDLFFRFYILAVPAKAGVRVEGTDGQITDSFAENFVDGELIPCYRGDCSGATTAVRLDSWGRIKASFRQAEENEP